LFVNILIVFAILSAVVAAVTFVLYARARMKEQEQKEKLFLSIHYTSLGILFLIGIVYMFLMIETET
jgi:hypothetical protein